MVAVLRLLSKETEFQHLLSGPVLIPVMDANVDNGSYRKFADEHWPGVQ
jgi:hypothetical protein